MYYYTQITCSLADLDDQKVLTLHGHSLLEDSSDVVATALAAKGTQ